MPTMVLGGTVPRTWVSESTRTFVACASGWPAWRNRTCRTSSRPVPVIVRVSPPVFEPAVGLIAVMIEEM